jgi:hypothetical protein
MTPNELLSAGLVLFVMTIGVFVIAIRFPKSRRVAIPLMFVLACMGLICNTMSIAINLQRM